jgi:hypothetical protein
VTEAGVEAGSDLSLVTCLTIYLGGGRTRFHRWGRRTDDGMWWAKSPGARASEAKRQQLSELRDSDPRLTSSIRQCGVALWA